MQRRLLSKPCLILVMGVAGTGKSTLSREILRRLRAVYLDNNLIADAFFPDTRNGPNYKRLRPKFYKALYRIAEENLKCGNSVLLDVPHIKEIQTHEWHAFIKNLTRKTESTLVAIRCFCSEKVLRARLSERGEKRDRWKLEHWQQFISAEPPDVAIPIPHLNLNTEKSLRRNVSAALRYILEHGA